MQLLGRQAPQIGDILARRTGCEFLTKLDVSMQFYTFALDYSSKELCAIATPFGLCCHCEPRMGVNQPPDIAREVMEKVLKNLSDDLEVYTDDIGSWLQLVEW